MRRPDVPGFCPSNGVVATVCTVAFPERAMVCYLFSGETEGEEDEQEKNKTIEKVDCVLFFFVFASSTSSTSTTTTSRFLHERERPQFFLFVTFLYRKITITAKKI